MSSKLPFISLLLLAACSGSADAGILDLAPPAETPDSGGPTKFISSAPVDASKPSEEDASSPSEDASAPDGDVVADAGEDASELDSGAADAAPDAPPVPRFGVTFDGQTGAAVAARMPADLIGKTAVTFEAYFRLNSATDRGLIFGASNAYCAVTTGGPATIHCCDHLNGANTCVVSPVVANQGTWYHVAWVLSSNEWTLFVNGAKQGSTASKFAAWPAFDTSGPTTNRNTHVMLGSEWLSDHAVSGTVDEFRLSLSALYAFDFAPAKHLDVPGALNLLLDEGTGTVSGEATLYGETAWSAVSR